MPWQKQIFIFCIEGQGDGSQDKGVVTEPSALSLIPGSQAVEGEPTPAIPESCPLTQCMYCGTYAHGHKVNI